VYQVRGFDLDNISFVRSDTGWIVFDPLTAKETAAAALALVTEHLDARPVVAVVYSHCTPTASVVSVGWSTRPMCARVRCR
jgi:alkyl sulfatase BDS1-like metallo-beta-lactamase superfamily hydrolase